MPDGNLLHNFFQRFFSTTGVVLIVVGILLLFAPETYKKIEDFLAKTYGIRKKIIAWLENDIKVFHLWLLKRRKAVGLAFLIFAIAFFTALKNF